MFKVAFLVYDRFQLQQVAGPLSIFEAGSGYSAPGYQAAILSESGGIIRSSAGVGIDTLPFRESGQSDILFVAGGYGFRNAERSIATREFIRSQSVKCRHIVSMSSGPMALAAAGVLDGHRATIHWSLQRELAMRYPSVKLCGDELLVRDRKVWTTTSNAAGMEVAAQILKEDFGPDESKRAMREFMSFQLHGRGMNDESGAERFKSLIAWARSNIRQHLSVEDLAERMDMTPRVFIPAFTSALHLTPAKAIERIRIQEALALLADPDNSLTATAKAVGFMTTARMRRAFLRAFGVGPQQMREIAQGRGH